ncbi:MAG TPA: chorismate synthase, partial [Chitinophagaceae bacterium]|nr:chorismate synthase [Chitinophagaceae bacterium]
MNTLGQLFSVNSFGESHGSHVGCVINGCPAGLTLDLPAIQQQVNRRKTNQQSFTSARQEDDLVQIVSGVYEGITLGSPIAILIQNQDAQSSDYDALKHVYRPGHADYTQTLKYGVRDHRGGGRSSIRVTAPLVAAGEIARQYVSHFMPLKIQAYVTQIGNISMSSIPVTEDLSARMEASEVRCPDEDASQKMLQEIEQARGEGDTLGGVIRCQISGLMPGLGEPIFGKFQACLSHAMMSINTVKGIEFGNGFQTASLRGSEQNDAFIIENDIVKPSTNHHSGLLGGIT